ncbi:MAG: hypothetical protein RBT68_12375 [Spirochaetia bacterium]|jgi:hypothetical protein|nr:hypothetical protein [Spirochaetia bacterium]
MKVVLVTRSKALELIFTGIDLVRLNPAELDPGSLPWSAEELVYLDLGSVPKRQREEWISGLGSTKGLHWAVIDQARIFPDPAVLFWQGAVDYIGAKPAGGIVNPDRLSAIRAYIERLENHVPRTSHHRTHQGSFPGWDALIEGKSYEVCALFTGVWDADGLRTRLGEQRFARFKAAVLGVVNVIIQEHSGLLWIADDQSFLALFPPEMASQLVISAMRVLANMRLISYEQLRLEQEVGCLFFCLRRCELPWQKPGQTGTVVSDALNYMYHLGRKFTPPCTIDLVDDLAETLEPRLKAHFHEVGNFENRPIQRFQGFETSGSGA